MFWSDPNWKPYRISNDRATFNEERLEAAVKAGLSELAKQNDALKTAIASFRAGKPAKTGTDSQIEGVDYNELCFYKERDGFRPVLVRLRVEIGVDLPSSLYFVVFHGETTMVDAGEPNTEVRDTEYKISLLSGKSWPIHEISERYGVDLTKAEEFTDFFTSFVAGDVASDEEPFCIVTHVTDVVWVDVEKLFDSEVQHWIGASEFRRSDVDKLIEEWASIKRVNFNAGRDLDVFIEKDLSKEKRREIRELIEASFKPTKGDEGSQFVHLSGLVQFGQTLFVALFRVQSNGRVDMVQDRPLHRATKRLPVDSWKFIPWNEDSLTFLVRYPRELIPSEAGLTKKATLGGAEQRDARTNGHDFPTKKTGSSVYNDLMREGDKPFSLRFEQVDFMDPLSFENSTLKGNVTFDRCRFLRPLNMVNARVGGTLRFTRCRFAGLPAGQDDEQFMRSIDLTGALITRSLEFDRCEFQDSVLLRGIHVEGRARIVGCTIEPRYDTDLKQAGKVLLRSGQEWAALDLRHGKFDGGLDLSADYGQPDGGGLKSTYAATQRIKRASGKTRPTIVVGPVRGEYCSIQGGLSLGGLMTSRLDPKSVRDAPQYDYPVSFANSSVAGGVVSWSPGDSPLEGYHLMRTVISGSLDFSHCRITEGLDLRGVWVGGSLIGNGMHCRGPLRLSNLSQPEFGNLRDTPNLELPFSEDKLVYRLNAPVLIIKPESGKTYTSVSMARFGRTHIGSDVNLTSSFCDNVHFDGCCVNGMIYCDNGTFQEIVAWPTISIVEQNDDLKFRFEALPTQPTVALNPFDGYLKDRIGKTIHAIPTQNIHPGPSQKELGVLIMNCEIHGMRMRDAHVKGRLHMHAVHMDPTDGAEASGTPAMRTDVLLEIENCTIDGPVLLFEPEFAKEWIAIQAASDVSRVNRLWQMVNRKQTQFDKSELASLLEEMIVPYDRCRIEGSVRIENTIIDGKLGISNTNIRGSVQIIDVIVKSDLKAGENRRGGGGMLTTEAESLDLEMLDCDGDVLLPGLVLTGKLSVRNMHVRGYLDVIWQDEKLGRSASTSAQRERAGLTHAASVIR